MHVMAVLDAIKKRGHFHDYKNAEKAHNEAEKAVESARAVYPCSTVPEQGQEGFARRRLKKPQRKLLLGPKIPSQKPRKPRKQPRQTTTP